MNWHNKIAKLNARTLATEFPGNLSGDVIKFQNKCAKCHSCYRVMEKRQLTISYDVTLMNNG